ncbi:MAG: TetR family transcriptional regulator [Desulfuromonadales bacterium GWD2_61_12]|nr:MAG: TetR family transcriptional regulator [Desulfuromonadales bacterium GWC2_61_20]OGR35213.1 MAG: TetR family transcriptional regulator [Desulfuromonadales bacterium GWD2_61_12]HAD03885.1 TetR/AcrR family transcriptional regulator [Desulfuromonas sp.]
MSTRERIVETALTLFNQQGSGVVSTNHIAAACGISPGNLYYHFRNKEEIIRAIFHQLTRVGAEEYLAINAARPPETAAAVTAMLDTFVMVQRFNWRYRFFKRELTVLLHHDPLLAAEFAEVHRSHRQMVHDAIARSVGEGFIAPLADEELTLFVEELWLIILFWLNYLEVGGEEVNDATLARGNAVLMSALRPHLTAPAREALAAVKTKER